ncbi:hypothetical protein MTOK_30290 [Mycolicibacterium tokaiense]|nr:hypothetical protein MTOK_30290 [Mycolicibacterium tokaiense]
MRVRVGRVSGGRMPVKATAVARAFVAARSGFTERTLPGPAEVARVRSRTPRRHSGDVRRISRQG